MNNQIIDFRFLTTDDKYDLKYNWWSRIYEYKYVLDMISKLGGNSQSKIHNTSWGWEGCHVMFKNDIDSLYKDSLHSDLHPPTVSNTIQYDITTQINPIFHNFFDFVINVSTIEEVNHPVTEILDNLLEQVKLNGYLIITFDYDKNNCNSFGEGSMNLNLVEEYLHTKITPMPDIAINGLNTMNPMIRWEHLNCGVLVIKKIL